MGIKKRAHDIRQNWVVRDKQAADQKLADTLKNIFL